MNLDIPSITLTPNQGERFPFNEFFKLATPETMAALKKVADEMGMALMNDLGRGHASNSPNPRRRRSAHGQRRTGAYFANQVHVDVANPVQKVPVVWISSTGKNSLAYEASHGNMARILQQFSGREGL
jgi:hypothetical protein